MFAIITFKVSKAFEGKRISLMGKLIYRFSTKKSISDISVLHYLLVYAFPYKL